MSDDYVGVKIDGVLYVKLDDVKPLRKAFDAAQARIERLREALRYYAENHYPNVNDGPWGVNSTDFGDVARAALANKGEKP